MTPAVKIHDPALADPVLALREARAVLRLERTRLDLARLVKRRRALEERNIVWDELGLRDRRTGRRARHLGEGAILDDWTSAYGDLLDRYRSDDGLFLAPSTANDRRYGWNWPFWRTWQEHSFLRAGSRLLCTTSTQAQAVLGGLAAYTIHQGMPCHVKARRGMAPPVELTNALQDVVDQLYDVNDLNFYQRELYHDCHQDGECLVRSFGDESTGLTRFRPVLPEQVIDCPGRPIEEGLFGVLTDRRDLCSIWGFHIGYSGMVADAEEVPEDSVLHAKLNVHRVVKRGMPDFAYDTQGLLRTAGRLLVNMGTGSAVQAAIALVQQWEAATPEAVSAYTEAEADYDRPNPWTSQLQPNRRIQAGEVWNVPKGMGFLPSPYNAGAAYHAQVAALVLRTIGARWNAPEWLISGDNSNTSYASSITAESPFVKTRQCEQAFFAHFFHKMLLRALRWWLLVHGGVTAGGRRYAPDEVWRLCELEVVPPPVEVRNQGEEATANRTRVEGGWKSPQQCAREEGLDPEQMAKELAEAAGAKQAQGPQQPGQNGGPAPGDDEPPRPPHPGGGVSEGLLEGDEGNAPDPDEVARPIAELLYKLFGADALRHLRGGDASESRLLRDGRGIAGAWLLEAWDSSHHPRGKGGRFIPRGSSEAVAAAKAAVDRVLKTGEGDAGEIADHLAILNVKQLRELHRANGAGPIPSAVLREHLVQAVKDRLTPKGKKKEAPAEQPKEQTPPPKPETPRPPDDARRKDGSHRPDYERFSRLPHDDALRAAARSGDARPLGGDTINAAALAKVEVGGEPFFWKGSSPEDAQREQMMSNLAFAAGLSAPAARHVEDGRGLPLSPGGKGGVLTGWVDGAQTMGQVMKAGKDPYAGLRPGEADRHVLFCGLVGALDRHLNNYMVDGDRLVSIDHEFSLGNDPQARQARLDAALRGGVVPEPEAPRAADMHGVILQHKLLWKLKQQANGTYSAYRDPQTGAVEKRQVLDRQAVADMAKAAPAMAKWLQGAGDKANADLVLARGQALDRLAAEKGEPTVERLGQLLSGGDDEGMSSDDEFRTLVPGRR